MTKATAAPEKAVVELSKTATQLISEIWDYMSLINGQEVSADEIRKETAIGDLAMAEYEHSLRQKLLKYRTAWQNSGSK